MKFLKVALLSLVFVFSACDHPFEFSVYEANVKSKQQNTTDKNLKLLESILVESKDFKFAFISDVHFFYDQLKTVINDINKRDDILFVIFGGDIADQALLREYEIFHDIMSSLKKPYLTVIGNHDYNNNGAIIYKKMFGDYNYSFEFNNNKFILFDDVVWESDKELDFDWFTSELKNNTNFNQVFVITHIPPNGDQFDDELEQKYRALMLEYNVPLSIHGHTHTYNFEEGDVSYLTAPAVKQKAYNIVSVKDKSFSVELIEL
ncbi:metallophosphoesterase family protein [Polaribacter sp. Hel1_85]|uniref:metallophosphoesterase family protein n=1 Tax=Polaribacter sp. Hel1_85 TaxID=1250005 RepID=UPI00052D8404|nr:metallophosphoesterase [Polaribacter sp. Hel1_85]KGL63755.1 metallophosphoesterase [Polaribacter sp. Hel1_85]